MVRWYEQTNDMFVLASVLIESLIQNHPFANANKRTAMMAGAVFLLLNGYELTAPRRWSCGDGWGPVKFIHEKSLKIGCVIGLVRMTSRELCKTGATIVLYETIKLKIEQQN